MECKQIQDLLYAYVCKALSQALEQQVMEHLKMGCLSCNKEWEEIQKRLTKIRGSEQFPSPQLSARKILKKARLKIIWFRCAAWSVVGFVFLAILGIGWLITRYRYEHILIEELEKAIFIYRVHTGQYPKTDERLFEILNSVPETHVYLNKWRVRIKDGLFVDHWGTPLVYEYPGKRNFELFDIYSFGINGKDDHGYWDDIKNWSPCSN